MAAPTFSGRLFGPWNWNRAILLFLKIVVGVFLIWFLVSRDIIDFGALVRLYEHYGYAILSATIFLVTVGIAAYRWQLLLAAQDIRLSLTTAIKVVGASYATSILLAGIIGGEGLRATWILTAMRTKRTVALLSLPVDRLCGLLALLAIGSLAVVLRWDILTSKSATVPLVVITLSLFAAAAIMIPIGFWFISSFPLFDRIADWENGRWGKRVAWQMARAITVYGNRKKCLIMCFFLSVLTNALTVVAFLILVDFMPPSTLSAVDIVFAFILSSLANVFSITPGGIGIGEGAFEVICRLIGGGAGSGYGTIFFMFRIVTWIPLVIILSAVFLGRWRTGAGLPS